MKLCCTGIFLSPRSAAIVLCSALRRCDSSHSLLLLLPGLDRSGRRVGFEKRAIDLLTQGSGDAQHVKVPPCIGSCLRALLTSSTSPACTRNPFIASSSNGLISAGVYSGLYTTLLSVCLNLSHSSSFFASSRSRLLICASPPLPACCDSAMFCRA